MKRRDFKNKSLPSPVIEIPPTWHGWLEGQAFRCHPAASTVYYLKLDMNNTWILEDKSEGGVDLNIVPEHYESKVAFLDDNWTPIDKIYG